MWEILERSWDLLRYSQDPMIRNVLASLFCVALYGLFISRDPGAPAGRSDRPRRCPDSVLRGGW